MSKREKIIIVLTIVAVIYGIYAFLVPAGKGPARPGEQKNIEELNRFAESVVKKLPPQSQAAFNAEILAKAAASWPDNPFIASRGSLTAERQIERKAEVKPAIKVDLAYTGYLVIGSKQLAIINGEEYEVGDELEEKGFVVKKITSTKVTLRHKDSNRLISIPLEEKFSKI